MLEVFGEACFTKQDPALCSHKSSEGEVGGLGLHSLPKSGSSGQHWAGDDLLIADAVGELADITELWVEDMAANQQQLAHLIALNSTCADCGESDPEWASQNLGIMICIRCSGLHRSLGSYLALLSDCVLTWLRLAHFKSPLNTLRPGPFLEPS